MAFNAKSKAYEETATLKLVDPETKAEIEEDGKPVTITLYGASSSKHRKAVDALLKANNKRGKREATLEERRNDSIDFLVTLSADTENFEDENGEAIKTAEQFKTLYSDESISWVRDQVQEFVGDPLNFLPK